MGHLKVLGAALLLGVLGTTGCQTKEKIVDIETPIGDVEVERDRATGETDVTVDQKN